MQTHIPIRADGLLCRQKGTRPGRIIKSTNCHPHLFQFSRPFGFLPGRMPQLHGNGETIVKPSNQGLQIAEIFLRCIEIISKLNQEPMQQTCFRQQRKALFVLSNQFGIDSAFMTESSMEFGCKEKGPSVLYLLLPETNCVFLRRTIKCAVDFNTVHQAGCKSKIFPSCPRIDNPLSTDRTSRLFLLQCGRDYSSAKASSHGFDLVPQRLMRADLPFITRSTSCRVAVVVSPGVVIAKAP